ncbi:glycoside hydrolase [Euzebyella marina]|uniref:Glycoside hydrolase n=1 Tax=Euzebyella marina TaxID=1761453 RepID=A0A3G2L1B2_9FLAO|nr:C40 family peptidase [Euzebyella marina]AYN66048.1 glycoside hydrolase [Euzebyella marina]
MIRIETSSKKLFRAILTVVLITLVSCEGVNSEEKALLSKVHEIREQYAPDKRTVLFDIRVFSDAKKYILTGETDNEIALAELRKSLESSDVEYIDKIKLLPSDELEGKTHAIVNISVANLRSNAKHSAELATQATLGTPVKVLKKEGGWYYIQTPDKYLSWVDDGGIQLMNDDEFKRWQSAEKIIYSKTYGHSYTQENTDAIVSDLVAGDVIETVSSSDAFYEVKYPDGRKAFVSKNDAENYNEWIDRMNPTIDDLVTTSKQLMGVPYLWGGTSTKGMDCSGFTKTIYFLNGMVIPRDASQQVHTGKSIDSVQEFDNLEKGDLLFFGRKATDSTAERVVHVGMWIGNNEFIHASNMVRISSMDPNAENFDEWNRNRYLRTKRILKEQDPDLIHLAQTPLFKE